MIPFKWRVCLYVLLFPLAFLFAYSLYQLINSSDTIFILPLVLSIVGVLSIFVIWRMDYSASECILPGPGCCCNHYAGSPVGVSDMFI